MTLLTPWHWRSSHPIKPQALLLSGRYVARLNYLTEQFSIQDIGGHWTTDAFRSQIRDVDRHLILIDRGDDYEIRGTKTAKIAWRQRHG